MKIILVMGLPGAGKTTLATPEARSLLPADFRVWVDTIQKGRFEDTNQMFVKPKNFDFHVTTQDAKKWAPKIVEEIKK